MTRLLRDPAGRQRGMTLIEVLVMVVGSSVVIGGAMSLILSTRGAYEVGGTQSSLQEVGRRMLDDVLADLRGSGLTTVAGQNYPAIYERPAGEARGDLYATMNYEDADDVDETLAYNGDGDRIERNRDRVTNEIVFQRPTDMDGDGRPIDSDGRLEWSDELLSYRIDIEPNGKSWLIRGSEIGGLESVRRVGPFITNITFDVVFSDRSMRFGTVAVVIYLQRVNASGQTITAALEGSVVLRNTEEL